MPLQLRYFYGGEADQFNFYRIPKALFTDSRFGKLMVLFHVHKGGVRVCFGKAVPALKNVIVPLILLFPDKKLPKKFNIPL